MATRRGGDAAGWLDTLEREGAIGAMDDGSLLARFREAPGRGGDAAFEVLVRRHGPLVLAACRRILRDEHAADDAFQATFLVLARRAATVRDPGRLAPWLGRVARRIALRSRAAAARRRALEGGRLDHEPEPGHALPAPLAADEAAELVRAAVDRLPPADRRLMQSTYWQGQTYVEAAAALGWPVGTVRSRLARARRRLRDGLIRGGFAPARIPWGAADLAKPTPPVPAALIGRAVRAAASRAHATTAAAGVGTVPASVAALADGEIAMTLVSWKSIAALILVGGAMTAGAATLAHRAAPAPPPAPLPPPSTPAPTPPTPTPAPAPLAPADDRPLLANGGVEDGSGDAPAAWTKGNAVAGVDQIWSRDGHASKSSLCLKKSSPRYFPVAEWAQQVPRTGNLPRLKVSAWIKAQEVSKAVLDVQFSGDDRPTHAWACYIGSMGEGPLPLSHGWKRYEGVVAIPPGTRQIAIAPQIYGPGTIWFDDLAAENTDAPATEP